MSVTDELPMYYAVCEGSDLATENDKRIYDRCIIRVGQLEGENEKLRELVRDFYPFASGRAAKPWLAVRRDRMRELGVEV